MKKKMEKRKTPEKRAGNLNFRLRIRAPEGTLLRVTSFPVKTLEKRAVKPPTSGCACAHPSTHLGVT